MRDLEVSIKATYFCFSKYILLSGWKIMETRDLRMNAGSWFWQVPSADLKTKTRLLTPKLYSYALDHSRPCLKRELQLSESPFGATKDIMCLPVCLRTEELTASFSSHGPRALPWAPKGFNHTFNEKAPTLIPHRCLGQWFRTGAVLRMPPDCPEAAQRRETRTINTLPSTPPQIKQTWINNPCI